MKTHEQRVEEFRQEFEKKRKKQFTNLWWQIPFITGVFIVLVWGEFTFYQIILGSEIAMPEPMEWGEKIFIIFAALCLLGFMGMMVYVLPSGFIERYRISYLKKFPGDQLQRSIKTIPVLKRRISMVQSKIEKQKDLLKQINDPKFTIITSNPLYSDNVSSSLQKNEELLKQHLESLDNCENNISQLKAKLEVYDQIPEKTFWQYLKSIKWLKKIN